MHNSVYDLEITDAHHHLWDLEAHYYPWLTDSFGPRVCGEYSAIRKNYLIDDLEVDLLYYNGRPIALELPTFVNLKVTYTEPGFKGDTASGGGKPATMQTGLTLTVPFHIKVVESDEEPLIPSRNVNRGDGVDLP